MRTSTITALIAGALVLAGCGTDSAGTSSTPGASTSAVESQAQFNDADVVFLEGMYPHHAQAVEMADMVAGHTDNADVVALAAAIKAAQQPEMDRITTWLRQWGQPVPTADMSGMDHGDGMMSADQMDALTALSGTEFEQRWLTMMIEHHEGAIHMADTELVDGENPEVKQMATDIVTAQQKEIADMRAALG